MPQKANPGDFIGVISEEKAIEGTLMPSAKKDVTIIKLDSGYNIGINKKGIKSINLIKPHSKKPSKKIILKYNKDLKTITILHTGGTIASQVDYDTGGGITRFTPEEIISMFPELQKIANVRSRLIRNMWSQDMRFSHYNIIAREIEKEIKKGTDGIIITHGTDTLGYTSAALSFILEELNIPVILVAAQRSSDRGSSDAGMNLVCAAHFITKSNFTEVAICMHENSSDDYCAIMPGTKTRKFHTSRRDAFKVVNDKIIARVDYKNGNIEYVKENYKKKDPERKLKLKLFNEKIKVALLKQHTNMFAEQFAFYKKYRGLVIESTGLGQLPTTKVDEYTNEHRKIFNTIKEMIKKGTIVVVTSQTIFGRINLNVYSNQREVQEIGVLGHLSDMLPETTFIKLAWLLSNHKDKNKIKELLLTNLRGEINNRLEKEFL